LPSPGDADYGGEAPADQHHANTAKTNIGPNPNFVIASVVDRSGAKWFGTWGAGLSRFDGRHWKTFVKEDGLGGNYVHVLALDADGNVWAGTDGGASWFDGRRWRTLSERDGLLNDNVFSIVFDPQGRRWFGTWEGLSMYGGRLPT
jgi:ligand-binding sensor domain-containing protein